MAGRVYWRQFACYSFMLTLLGVHVLFQYAVVPNAVGLAGSDWAPAESVSGPDLALACEQWIGRRSLKVPKGFVGPEVDEAEDSNPEQRVEEPAPVSTTTTAAPTPQPWAAAGVVHNAAANVVNGDPAGAAGAAGAAGLHPEAVPLQLRRTDVHTQDTRLHFPRHLTNEEAEVGLGDNGGSRVSRATSGATLRPPPQLQTITGTPPGGARDSDWGQDGARYRPHFVQLNPTSIGDRLNRNYPSVDAAQGVPDTAPGHGGFIVPAPSQPSTTHPWAQRFQDHHINIKNSAGLIHKESNHGDNIKQMHLDQPSAPLGVAATGYNSVHGSQGVKHNRGGALHDVDSELHRAQNALLVSKPGLTEPHNEPYSELHRTQAASNSVQGSVKGAQHAAHQAPLETQGAPHGAQHGSQRKTPNPHGVNPGSQGHEGAGLPQHPGLQLTDPKAADHPVVADHQVALTSNPLPAGGPNGQGGLYNGQGVLDQVSGGNHGNHVPQGVAQGVAGSSRLLYQNLPGDQGIVPGGHHGVLPGKHGVVYDNQPGHHGNQKLLDQGMVSPSVPSVVHQAGVYRTRDDSTNPHHQRYMFNCANIQLITIKRKLGQGVTKQVYLGVYDNRKVAVKMVTRNVIDVLSCMKKLRRETADLSTLPGEKHKCYTLPNMKLMKEILLLNQLDHPNLLKLQGYCVRSEETDSTSLQEHGIVAVYEYGLRFYISNLRGWPWQLRVRTAVELADLLEYLQHSPLGSLRVSDFKDAHFLLKDGRIKLTDLDDVTSMEPECQPNLGPELDLKGNRTPSKVCGYNLRCVAGICPGYNAMKNLDNFNRLFFSELLAGDTPETEEHMSRLRSRLDNLSIDASELRRILMHFMDVPFLPGYS